MEDVRVLDQKQTACPGEFERAAFRRPVRIRFRRVQQDVGYRLHPVIVYVDHERRIRFHDRVVEPSRNLLTHAAFRIAGKASVQVFPLGIDISRDILESHGIDQRKCMHCASTESLLAKSREHIVDDCRPPDFVSVDTGSQPHDRSRLPALRNEHGNPALNDVAQARYVDEPPRDPHNVAVSGRSRACHIPPDGT